MNDKLWLIIVYNKCYYDMLMVHIIGINVIFIYSANGKYINMPQNLNIKM